MIERVEEISSVYNPVQEHIQLVFRICANDSERLQEIVSYWKAEKFDPVKSRAIVFVTSRKKAEENAEKLPKVLETTMGRDCIYSKKIAYFHARMDPEDRKDVYDKFRSGEIAILFATKAFGMGLDIPNIHYVTHYSPPGTFEDYLQEVGRAGREKESREAAGFGAGRRIRALCVLTKSDFGNLLDLLHDNRLSWMIVKAAQQTVHEYIGKFGELVPDAEQPLAVPFDLFDRQKNKPDDDTENLFRLCLYWLERLNRIRLGYYTPTFLTFDRQLIEKLATKLPQLEDGPVKSLCTALLAFSRGRALESQEIQVEISSLSTSAKLGLAKTLQTVIAAQKAGLVRCEQKTLILPTKLRKEEIEYCLSKDSPQAPPALKVIIEMAKRVLGSVSPFQELSFDGTFLDREIDDLSDSRLTDSELGWIEKDPPEKHQKKKDDYVNDVKRKRSKHCFTLLRLMKNVKHTSAIEDNSKNGTARAKVVQQIYNGYTNRQQWETWLAKFERDCLNVLMYVQRRYIQAPNEPFRWVDMVVELELEPNIKTLENVLFILKCLGYVNVSGSLMPTGIELYLLSKEEIDENDRQKHDHQIYQDFRKAEKTRELKLLALRTLSEIDPERHEEFIKQYFQCNSYEQILSMLEAYLGTDHVALSAFREDALRAQEDSLNSQQRLVYDSHLENNISVIAGPGSGKTHTLTLRVARLIQNDKIPADKILVIAYNRAVVTELKERLNKLFRELGYGTIARRIKVFTFQGLAKRCLGEQVQGVDLKEWEKMLFQQLSTKPGVILDRIGPNKFIFVDEFQDVTNLRLRILQRLVELDSARIFVIGDPNQSIYGYEKIKEKGDMNPWSYYEMFDKIFNPKKYYLSENFRSYPAIIDYAQQVLPNLENTLRVPALTARRSDRLSSVSKYCEEISLESGSKVNWEDSIAILLNEKTEHGTNYRQIAVLFRTNNEVYRGYEKIRKLGLKNIRIRIQGSMEYEFSRVRECSYFMQLWKSEGSREIPKDLTSRFAKDKSQILEIYPSWNSFYVDLVHAVLLDFIDQAEEGSTFNHLYDYLNEVTYKDDGQLYKIYQKHRTKISNRPDDCEIVLSTMHKIKGLEFDAVIVPPSFANLPLIWEDSVHIEDWIDEERRLYFVAYTRARFRLIVFKFYRESKLKNGEPHTWNQEYMQRLGVSVQAGLAKLYISWSANDNHFHVNKYLENKVRSGDSLSLVQRDGNWLVTHGEQVVGRMSGTFNVNASIVSGFVVNEVVAWSYEDTLASDKRNKTSFINHWGPQAKEKGYIYLVDFAGYGQLQ